MKQRNLLFEGKKFKTYTTWKLKANVMINYFKIQTC